MGESNTNQHWVPKFYLRQFAVGGPTRAKNPGLWATPVDEGPARISKVRELAAGSYLYTTFDDNGSRDDRVDSRLQELESVMGGLWHRVAADDYAIDEPFRKAMSVFLATLILRNPRHLDLQYEARKKMIDALDAAPKDASGRPRVDRIVINGKESLIDVSDWERFCNPTHAEMHEEFVRQILVFAKEGAEILLSRKPWYVVFSDEPVFATSDHPVVLFNENQKRPGLRNENTIIYFPLTPSRMLVIGEQGRRDGLHFPLRKGGEGLFNFFVFRGAYRTLFTATDPSATFEGILRFAEGMTGHASPESILATLGEPARAIGAASRLE